VKILGLNAFTHDAAAALLVDGRLAAMAEEERFTREKHSGVFPEKSIAFCLERAGLKMPDLDATAFAWNPWSGVARRLLLAFTSNARSLRRSQDLAGKWFSVLGTPARLRRMGFRGKFHFVYHYDAHAASVFYPSGFGEAAVLVLDGVGEKSTGTLAEGRGMRLRRLMDIPYPHSLGLFYATFTELLGWRHNCDEGKMMGLAPYGRPIFLDEMRKLMRPDGRGGFTVHKGTFDFSSRWVTPELEARFGPRRRPEDPLTEHHRNVAASAQALLEECALVSARRLRDITGLDSLCYTGGVNLNCSFNGRLARERIFRRHYFLPAAYDAGTSLGAALWVMAAHGEKFLDAPMLLPFHGPSADEGAIRRALEEHGLQAEEFPEVAGLLARVAALLNEGRVVGWFHGRMEMGPRALGGRSILANPGLPRMKDTVNMKVKKREPFRPFAPSVPEERAHEFFEMTEPSPFMLMAVPVRERWRARLPAVTHVDGSARVQTVSAKISPRFHALHLACERLGMPPVLLNTSFNLAGEPIVNTPSEAVASYLKSGMDALVLENFLVHKS
jgi:carbamoyltransferase